MFIFAAQQLIISVAIAMGSVTIATALCTFTVATRSVAIAITNAD